MLKVLRLRNLGLCCDVNVTCALLLALVGHPSLRELELNEDQDAPGRAERAELGDALGAIVAADAPALRS